jgi:hypothetical protein
MIYQMTILTPANTSKVGYKETILKVTKGLIYQVEVEFPFGPLGLTGCAIFDEGHQIYPTNEGEWFSSNARLISFQDLLLKEVEPFRFLIRTYNLDIEYEHRVYVRIGMVSKKIFKARFMPHIAWTEFERILKEATAVEPYEEEEGAIIEAPFPDEFM